MKKILLILIFGQLLITILRFPSFTSAQELNWQKYPTPVLLQGLTGSWDSSIHTAAVIYAEGKLQMWYGGWDGEHGRIGYATSNDGLTWQKYPNYVLDVIGDERQVGSPTVLFDNGSYKMWFLSAPTQTILYAESQDGISWTRQPISGLNKYNSWESQSHGPGTVLKIGNTYYLWYTGVGDDGLWRVGVATSNDGLGWEQYDGNPISGDPAPWEENNINHPAVVKYGDILFLVPQR